MANDINRSIKIYIDSTEAGKSIEGLQEQIQKLEKELNSLDAEDPKQAARAKDLKKALEDSNKTLNTYKNSVAETDRVLHNLSGATYKELIAVKQRMTQELQKTTRGTTEYNMKLEMLKRVSKEAALAQKDMRVEVGCQASSWGRAADFINKYMGLIGSAVAGITGITMAFGKLRDERDKLEASSANTKALTGLGDEDVQTLEDAAKRLSTTVTKEGVRIKQSAVEISDSFAVIGSQRPELLKSAEALEQVTQDAIYLSIAGKDKLEPAAKALTTVMNQMNLGADQSRRIINAIAAGSQAGAGNIQYITDAFEKSGTSANLMNIQLEQHIGLIEAVAPKYSEAAVAGNSLDRVLLRMKEKNIGYKDGVFDLSRAIDELDTRFKNGESAVSLFGSEHAKMASILVMNKADILKYTEAVTGTNKAVEQANINSDINEVKRAQARNKMNLLGIELMDKLNPAINSTMNQMVHWTGKLVTTADWISKNTGLIISLITTIGLYTVAIKLNTYWTTLKGEATSKAILIEKKNLVLNKASAAAELALAAAKALLTGNIKAATVAMRGFLVTLGLNPVVAAGVAIAALTVGVYKLCTRTTEADKAMKSFFESSIKEEAELNKLYRALKRSGEGTELRTKLLGEFNTKYGEYLPNLLSENSTLGDIETAYRNVTRAMKENLAQRTLDKGTEDIEQTALEDKANLLLNIKDKMVDLPESVVKDALGAITKLTDKGVEAGLNVDRTWESVLERIRKEFYHGDNQSLAWANDLDEYIKKVYETADKIDDLKEKLNPFLPKKTDSKKPANELEDVVVTPDKTYKPSVTPEDAAKADKKMLDAKLKEVDRYIADKKLKLSQDYTDGLLMYDDYSRKQEALELEKLNKQLEVYKVGTNERKKIEQLLLDYRIKLIDKGYQEYLKNIEKEGEADKKRQKDKEAVYKQLNDSLQHFVEEQNIEQQKQVDQQKAADEKRAQTLLDFSAQAGQILGESLTDSENSFADAMGNVLLLTLDSLRQIVTMAIAERTIKNIATLGFLGLAKAAGEIALINIAFGAIKGLIKKPTVAGAKGETSGATPQTGQRVSTGNTTGWFNGGWSGNGSPYEVAGPVHREEYVVPAWEVQEPAAMNHIAALEAIRRQRTNANPLPAVVGFANGGYDGRATEHDKSQSTGLPQDLMMKLLYLFQKLDNKGVKAYVVYSELQKAEKQLEESRKIGSKS